MKIQDYPDLYQELQEIFNEEDPQGFIRMGAPSDEYTSEIEMAFKRRGEMKNIGSTRHVLHNIFVRMLDERIAGTPDVYTRLAERVFATLRREGFV